ncbi:TetR/AcrR family transcriptional regulator (plasmid) [Burkholderia multivorans]|uniref:TetR/AcrR family transcriptional regulator n=1 Tax=Burkholderia multivorans TaxID=87883 RepID=UPI002018B04B|nr:TetR/AcrR family transcriptional regulator [Burkholderia multivorans]MCO1459776.1 TetR/AcrR family transcriptional regulator [Burkholderia multivorans]UQO21218.1 TetR/AcrR family transcriptional regulator [Burkholderia multivorans]UQO87450.1 TetR/AcrR family transcriptional regulator [Burkholderia multivorans]
MANYRDPSVGNGHERDEAAISVDTAATTNGGIDGGTAQQRNRERRIREILLAATDVFRDEGYAGFTARKVAAKAGLSLSNLQYYFPAREELLSAIINDFLQDAFARCREIVERGGISAQRRCALLIETIFAAGVDASAKKFLFEIWAFAQHDPSVSGLLTRVLLGYRDLFATLLSEMNPALEQEQCRARAWALTVQAEGMMILVARGQDSLRDREEFVRTARRGLKVVAGLTEACAHLPEGGEIGISPMADRSALDAEGGMFESGGLIRHSRYEQTVRQGAIVPSYLRPTMQNRRREQKINEIVEAAAAVLTSEGYGNFTLARVAREAGILTSGLQYYFPAHEDLLSATINALFSHYYDRWSRMGRPSDKPPLERLFEIIEEVFVEACDPRVCRFSFEMFALAEHSAFTANLLRSTYEAYRQIYVDLVHEIDPSASGRECLARATLIAAQLEGLLLHTYSTGWQTPGLGRLLVLFKTLAREISSGFPGNGRAAELMAL